MKTANYSTHEFKPKQFCTTVDTKIEKLEHETNILIAKTNYIELVLMRFCDLQLSGKLTPEKIRNFRDRLLSYEAHV